MERERGRQKCRSSFLMICFKERERRELVVEDEDEES